MEEKEKKELIMEEEEEEGGKGTGLVAPPVADANYGVD